MFNLFRRKKEIEVLDIPLTGEIVRVFYLDYKGVQCDCVGILRLKEQQVLIFHTAQGEVRVNPFNVLSYETELNINYLKVREEIDKANSQETDKANISTIEPELKPESLAPIKDELIGIKQQTPPEEIKQPTKDNSSPIIQGLHTFELKVTKVGHSYYIRLPKGIYDQLHLSDVKYCVSIGVEGDFEG